MKKPKPNRKGRINSFPPKQHHTAAQGQIMACTVSLDGVKVHRRDNPKLKGFTLLEIMIVVCIIGILSGIAVPSMMKRIDYARAVAVVKNTQTVNTAVYDYMLRQGAQEITFGELPTLSPSKWEDVESLISGGFEACAVTGYIFELDSLRACYISQVCFKGIQPSELYTKL